MSICMVLFGASLPSNSVLAQTIKTTTNHDQKSTSLAKLASYYHPKPSTDARCQGVWIHPNQSQIKSNLTKELGASGIANQDSQAKNTYYAQSDYGYYDNDEYAELSGNVILEQNGQQISADKITFNPKTGESSAKGQVIFGNDLANSIHNNQNPNQNDMTGNKINADMGIIGVANELNYNAKTQTANAQDVAFASTTIGAHGYAKQMQKVNDHQYKMNEVMFTTCPPTEHKWHLDAKSIEFDTQTGRGIAKNSTLKIKDVPVFYLPYFNFPIDDRRVSGFLLPNIGLNLSDGLQMTTPYYLNLAPNFDATLSPTIFSNRNPMLGVKFRYLTKQYGSGVLDAVYLPNDRKQNNKNRHHLFFNHEWHAKDIKNLTAYATYRHVSDSNYLTDFDKLGLENNPLNLPRRLGVDYYNEYLSADLRIETFQTLQGRHNDGTPIQDKDKPYSRLPQLAVNFTLPKSDTQTGKRWKIPSALDRFDITALHNLGYFKKSIRDESQAEKSGIRMYNKIVASYPMLKDWGYFTPKLSLHHLYASYDQDSLTMQNINKANGRYSVFAPQISLDMATFFEKSGSPFGWFDDTWGGHQVLSPRLKYNHTPYKDQSNIPNFETSFAAISYDQLLSDSWFLGYDRIQDLHAITPAISYRYMDKNGVVRFDGGIAQQFYLSKFKVRIDDDQQHNKDSSGMAWKISAQPTSSLWIDASGSLTHHHQPNHFITQLRYQPNKQSLYSIGMIDRKQNRALGQLPLQAYTASAIFPVNHHWRIVSQAQYDQRNNRLLDALIGINYEDCCYGFSIYARRHRNSLNPNIKANNTIMAEIRLNGITNGGRLNRLMSDKVVGYDTTQDAWQQAY